MQPDPRIPWRRRVSVPTPYVPALAGWRTRRNDRRSPVVAARGATGRATRPSRGRLTHWSALALLLGVVHGPPVWAQARWYQIEVIVFRQADAGTTGGEQWPPLASFPDFSSAQRLLVDLPAFTDEPAAVNRPGADASEPVAFLSLSARERQLGGIAGALRHSSRYDPVLHAAWRQPAAGSARARAIYLSDRPEGPLPSAEPGRGIDLRLTPSTPAVEGIIRFRAGRRLYVDADFVFYGAEVPVRLQGSRKVKLKEIHYLDHPLFGILVQVTPYHPPSELPPDGDAALQPPEAQAVKPGS